jgi:hypothetical protein
MIPASHSHPSLILSQLPRYIHLLYPASFLTSIPTIHMSSPTIVRLVLQVDYKLEHNKVFEHGALNLSNIAAERPQRYRREVLLIGLLD